jgi:hypothetical protein
MAEIPDKQIQIWQWKDNQASLYYQFNTGENSYPVLCSPANGNFVACNWNALSVSGSTQPVYSLSSLQYYTHTGEKINRINLPNMALKTRRQLMRANISDNSGRIFLHVCNIEAVYTYGSQIGKSYFLIYDTNGVKVAQWNLPEDITKYDATVWQWQLQSDDSIVLFNKNSGELYHYTFNGQFIETLDSYYFPSDAERLANTSVANYAASRTYLSAYTLTADRGLIYDISRLSGEVVFYSNTYQYGQKSVYIASGLINTLVQTFTREVIDVNCLDVNSEILIVLPFNGQPYERPIIPGDGGGGGIPPATTSDDGNYLHSAVDETFGIAYLASVENGAVYCYHKSHTGNEWIGRIRVSPLGYTGNPINPSVTIMNNGSIRISWMDSNSKTFSASISNYAAKLWQEEN